MSHTIISVTPHGPSEPGALDGWTAICSCGFTTGSSLGERWASRQGYDHAEYMNRKAAPKQRKCRECNIHYRPGVTHCDCGASMFPLLKEA